MSQDEASRRIILDTALKTIGKTYGFATQFLGNAFCSIDDAKTEPLLFWMSPSGYKVSFFALSPDRELWAC